MITIPGYQIHKQSDDYLFNESRYCLIYRARRIADQHPVILKLLKSEYPTPAELGRFRREYDILRHTNSDGIIGAYNLEKFGNGMFLVFEDFGGRSLKSILSSRQLDLHEFFTLAIRITSILEEIHQQSIIHKDINPANILWNPETDQVKLIDFGISTKLPKEHAEVSHPNVLEGTLAYMSPEQTGRMNRSMDYRTDLYSLGVTLYEMLTGQCPFPSKDPIELVHCHIAQMPVPAHEFGKRTLDHSQPISSSLPPHTIPKVLSDIIQRLMAKNAEDRYQTTFGLKMDLQNCWDQLQKNGSIQSFEIGTHDISDKFQILQKLYGREQEIKALLTAFERVSLGAKECMLVAGFSGIGKSAVINEVHKPITGKRGIFISGKFDQFKRNDPYLAIIHAFQELIRQLLTESEKSLQTWKKKILHALGKNGKIIIEVIPEIELIIGEQPPVPYLGVIENQNRFNGTFQKFVSVFTQKEHPLTIFLDDLQWADSASLNLIKVLMLDPDLNYLFLIGAYRDNEVHETHPLIGTLDVLKKSGTTIQTLTLQPLNHSHVAQLISETIHSPLSDVMPLAEIIMEKTGGNPFFTIEILRKLYQDRMLQFDFTQRTWTWDIQKITGLEISDNVIVLMIEKINKLPDCTQRALRFGACIGSHFDLKTLSVICEKSLPRLAKDLWPAIEEGLLFHKNEDHSFIKEIDDYSDQSPFFSLNPVDQFQHDRVQQAVYSMIPEAERRPLHLKIGRLLLENNSETNREEKLFYITAQFNQARALISDETEQILLAELNLQAGMKAKESTAYGPALGHASIAMELLPNDSWHTHYPLTFELHKLRAEAEYLSGNFAEAEKYYPVALNNAQSVLDKVSIYFIQMNQYELQGQFVEGVQCLRNGLELLAITFPDDESELQKLLEQELQESIENLKHQDLDDLLNAAEITDPHQLAVLNLLMGMWTPCYVGGLPLLLACVSIKLANLSMKWGNSEIASISYVVYSFLRGILVGDWDVCQQIGKMGLELSANYDNLAVRCKCNFIFGVGPNSYTVPLQEAIANCQIAFEQGVSSGDLSYASYAAHYAVTDHFFQGSPLSEVAETYKKYSSFLERTNISIYDITKCCMQPMIHLRELDEGFDDGAYLNAYQTIPIFEAMYYLGKLHKSYLFAEQDQWIFYADKAMELVPQAIVGTVKVPETYCLSALIYCAAYPTASEAEKRQYLEKISTIQQQMKTWSTYCEANFLHKYLLVEAERSHILECPLEDVMNLYEGAIASAQKHDFLQYEALANELYAKFWLHKNREEIAKLYMTKSYYLYGQWGAPIKAEELRNKFPQLLSRSENQTKVFHDTSSQSMSSSKSGFEMMDLATVIKASQSISSEITLEKMLANFMNIVIENAGAERGILLLEKNGKWFIEAEGIIGQKEVNVLQSLPMQPDSPSPKSVWPYPPVSIIHYVARTQESLVLDIANADKRFANDAYILQNDPQSILCEPILHHGVLTGILYLENNLTTGAFTPERLEILNLLSSQAAISIENARFYRVLEQKVEERTEQLEISNEQLIKAKNAAEAANHAKSEFLANMSHEIRTPMNAILGFAEIMKRKVKEPQLSRYLEFIHSSGKSLLSLINDILDLSRVEAGKLKLEYTATSPQNLFREMETIFGQVIRDKGLELIIDIPSDLPKALLLDETRLRQILTNLVGNAVKFTESGYIKLSVDHHYPDDAHYSSLDLTFSVEDTGKGIPEDQKQSIFESFTQVKGQKVSQFGGTGLGLTITKRLVEMLNGEIDVDSTLDQGSTFRILLKDVEVTSLSALTGNQQKHIDFHSIRFAPNMVLIADDIDFNRDLIKNYLEDYELTLIEAENGKEAIELAKQHHPQLILLDIKMPEMDGLAAADALKKEESLQTIPLIAISASAMKKDEDTLQELCDSYLMKPVSKTDIVLEIMKFLPHTITKEKIDNIPKAKPIRTSQELTPATLAKLPELLDILRVKQEDCVELSQRNVIHEIENFALENQKLGANYQYAPLIDWAGELHSAASGFDIEKMKRCLGNFQTLILNAEKHIEGP